MTTDSAKPAVITAAQFVTDGYAERIAAGECVVRDAYVGECVSKIRLSKDPMWFYQGYYPEKDERRKWLGFDKDAQLSVEWLPATPSTDDEVTRLRAENARLREALQGVITNTSAFRADLATSGSQAIFMIRVINERLTAALDATGEAS